MPVDPAKREMVCVSLLAIVVASCADAAPDEVARAHPREIELVETCPGCGVRFVELASLGSLEDPASVRDDAAARDCMVGRLSDGRFVVSGAVGGGQLLVYDEDGRIEAAFGRRGAGPGELGADLRLLVGVGDTLFVLDDSQARMNVFDASGRFHRSFRAPVVFRPFVQGVDGDLFFQRDPTSQSDPILVRLDREGDEKEGIGRPRSVREHEVFDTWTVTASSDGGLWLSSIWTYELWRVSADGTVQEVFSRDASWFPSGGRYEEGAPIRVPPPPLIRFTREDGNGRLWVYTVVPDEQWEPGVPQHPSYVWGRRVFDTRIEVLDVENGRVLASERVDHWIGGMCGGSLVYTVEADDDGNTRLRVWEPLLIEPAGD